MGYSYFAEFYDELTSNVDYHKKALYIVELLKRFNHKAGLTLDLASGTGSLTLELKNMGIDIFGVDKSPEMLSKAQEKALNSNVNILYLCQDMSDLDLYGTVDTVICSLDGLNHIVDENRLRKCFERISLFLNKDGYFIFDMNTVYKHKNILGDNVFIYDMPSVYCVWQNTYNDKNKEVKIDLDFFHKMGEQYTRYEEHFSERAYTHSQILNMLSDSGLELVECYTDMTMNKATENDEKVIYITKKP